LVLFAEQIKKKRIYTHMFDFLLIKLDLYEYLYNIRERSQKYTIIE